MFKEMFEKFAEISPLVWGILAALLLLSVIGILLTRSKKMWNTRMLVYGALCLALSFVLSYIRLFHMPQGGSVTPASMLPIMLYAYAFGPVPGLLVGAANGLLQLLQDMYVVHPLQLVLDYPLAYAMIGLAGCFRKQKNLWAGVLLGGFARWLCAVISGTVFFAEYAPEGQPALLYSMGYNGAYMGVDTAICLVISLVPPLKHQLDRISFDMKKAVK